MKRLYCKDYCSLWDTIDKDCDMYGERHPRLRECPIFRRNHPEILEELLFTRENVQPPIKDMK